MRASGQAQAGFTLVEVIVSLALFALISLGGLALVDTVLRTEERLGGRLDRLGELQRAMLLVTRDLEQSAPGSLALAGDALRFARRGPSLLAPAPPVAYGLQDGALVRGAGGTVQRVLPGVAAVRWRFLYPGGGWSAAPPDPDDPRAPPPRAVSLELDLAGDVPPRGALRRVVELPQPPPRPIEAAPAPDARPSGLLDRAT